VRLLLEFCACDDKLSGECLLHGRYGCGRSEMEDGIAGELRVLSGFGGSEAG
jgi:hypothetical protein